MPNLFITDFEKPIREMRANGERLSVISEKLEPLTKKITLHAARLSLIASISKIAWKGLEYK